MRFFVWLDFQYEMIALFLGGISLIMVYAAWAGYRRRRAAGTEREFDQTGPREPGSGDHTDKGPIGPFLIYTYLLIAAWAFSYLIYVWANGSRF
ncbi:MAG TPA: hypothetical protein HPP57_09295 [Deltaproteobacteria bacterium]|jgi:hypothetical protein|nr:hypothetical protein [Deltaproteobacteria bacterium]